MNQPVRTPVWTRLLSLAVFDNNARYILPPPAHRTSQPSQRGAPE